MESLRAIDGWDAGVAAGGVARADGVVATHGPRDAELPWASVTKLRTLMRQPSENGAGPATGARPCPFESLSDALVGLFRALTDHDEAAVRRYSVQVWATVLQAGAS